VDVIEEGPNLVAVVRTGTPPVVGYPRRGEP